MADGMSFDKYIDNPSGGASVVTNRKMYKEMYKQKFDAVLLREQGKIEYTVYHDNDSNDSYYIYIKVPSEVIEKFYYDVVIRLYTKVSTKKASISLREYAVEFYSNDPAFVYTFAYSFSKNKLFIKDLESKMSKKALTDRAKTRNPNNNVWYVKSLYFAYLTMEKYNLFNRTILNKSANKYSKRDILSKIEHADKKVLDRQEAAKKLERKKTEDKKDKESKPRNIGVATANSKQSTITKTVATSKTTKKVSSTKTSKITSMRKK